MDMRKLLEAVTKFAGEPKQRAGDQVRGTDTAKKGSKEHPFKGRLVGDSKDNMLRGLSQVAEDKSLEWELAEAYSKFMEDDLGVEPKRPSRKGSRHARGHKPKSGYTTVKEYKKDTDNFTADDIKELEGIKDLATLKERAFALISTPSKKPMKPEKVAWFKSAIERMTNPAAVIKLMWDLLLSGEGQAVIGSRSSMNPNSYRSRFNEGWGRGTDRVSLPDTPGTYYSGTGQLQKEYDALYAELVPSMGKADTIEGEVLRAASKIIYRHYNDGDEFNQASFDQLKPYIGHVTSYDDLAHKATMFAAAAEGEYHPNPSWDSLDVMEYGPEEDDEDDYDDEDEYYDQGDDEEDELDEGMEEFAKAQAKQRAEKRKSIPWPKEVPSDMSQEQDDEDEPHPYGHELDEGAADIYSITSERNGRERSKSGTLAELIEYYSYTLETGKSYEHERGRKKINLNPKNIESLVQNLNNAKSNAAANGQSNERFYVDHGNMAEGWAQDSADAQRRLSASATARVLQKYQDNPELSAIANFMSRNNWTAQAIDDTMQGRGKFDVDWWKGQMAKNLPETKHKQKQSAVYEGIESADPVEGAVLAAVQELIQQGHTEVAPEVITNMVVAATSQPFLLKDLVDANKNSSAIQHYVDSINPTKVKFSSDILTVKNENPAKEKQASQTGVANMAARAANRPRLGEASTPLRDREDYAAKNKALQDIQMNPSTSRDPQLSAELARRKAELVQQAKQLGISESRAHKIIANKLKQIELQRKISGDHESDDERNIRMTKQQKDYIKNNPNTIFKRDLDEYGADQPTGTAGQTSIANKTGANDPQQAAKVAQATQALKSATGASAPAPEIAKALDAASQGNAMGAADMKAIEPMVDVLGQAAQDPKLANQFKTLANQAKQTQSK